MAKQLNVMFDVDGVLADYCLALSREATRFDSTVRPWDVHQQGCYDFSDRLSREVIQQCIKFSHESYNWWVKLTPLVDTSVFRRIQYLHLHATVTFCTQRNGTPNAQLQTVRWLRDYGLFNPSVIIAQAEDKRLVAKAIRADYSIEDRVENANDILDVGPTRSYLIDRPYNTEGKYEGVRRIATVERFLDDIEKDLGISYAKPSTGSVVQPA